jgi:hypothetical protein
MSTNFDINELTKIANILNLFPEVVWDKYADDGTDVAVYGWLRDSEPRDFMVLTIDQVDFTFVYVTNSTKFRQAFHTRTNTEVTGCQRYYTVRNLFPVINSVA